MRRLTVIALACGAALAAPLAARAQPALLSSGAGNDSPAAPAAQATPAASQPASQSGPDLTRGLFEPTWSQFQVGGRFTGVDGDPARFQRYQDMRSGLLFTDARYERGAPEGDWLFRATADNVGWRNQKYTARYERAGLFSVSGLWDEIPQFYSVDTKTPYTQSGNPLLLDDATQQRIQQGQANLSAYVPIAPQFDLRERRGIGSVNLLATPTPNLDLTAAFTTTRHTGELPWGGSFGFSNDVEVAVPYDSRTNDLTLGTEWTNGRNMLRVAYNGMWFENLADTLVWDSPLRLTDSTASGPGQGRMSLWPTNSAQTISASGYTKFARRTQLTGSVSFGFWNNDEPLQPFTINAALPVMPLPRTTAQAEAQVFSTNLNLVTRPLTNLSFTARLRRYDYNNQTPVAAITQFINYDTSVTTSSTGGPELYAHSRTNFDADATWTALQPVALTVGYTHNDTGHVRRIFDGTGEDVLRLAADAVGSSAFAFHAKYQYSSRTGSGLDEALLEEIHEQPAMRHYDFANRTRNQFTGIVDFVPTEQWTFSVSGGVGQDDFPDSYFGLQETTFRNVSLRRRLSDGERAGRGRHLQPGALLRTAALAFVVTGGPVQRSESGLDCRLRGDGELLLDLRHASEPGIADPGARVVRLQPRGGELPVHGGPGRTPASAVAAAERVLQAPAAARRREAPADGPAGPVRFVPVRAVPGLRLRFRPVGREWHRAAQLAGPRIRLPSVHGQLRYRQLAVLLVA